MLAKVNSVAHIGLQSVLIEVEVDVASKGFPGFSIVGLPNKAVEEAKERVKTALINTGFDFPQKRITVNLAPADIGKTGSCYDLPIAIGILLCSEQIQPKESLTKTLFYGELSLDGSVRHTKGVLLVAIFAQKHRFHKLYIPASSAQEAVVVSKIETFPVKDLEQLANHLNKTELIMPQIPIKPEFLIKECEFEFNFNEVLGQHQAKRALIIAAAGGHNILLSGPPGSGKTMLARALPSILPPLTSSEALAVTQIYSAAGLLNPGEGLIKVRPFRFPHHSTSLVGLIGGGANPMPGEISLAHYGVIFLDEMAEFPRSVLEALRQPMEDHKVVISRAAARVKYPANFMLVAAVNPCPCGYLNHPKKECQCSIRQIERYKRRLSGPILDRIDLHVFVPAVEAEKLSHSKEQAESSFEIRKKVVYAREFQTKRLAESRLHNNAQMRNKEVKQFCELNKEARRLIRMAIDKYSLSARSYFRILKVARTIADLAGAKDIKVEHLAEALQYRLRVF